MKRLRFFQNFFLPMVCYLAFGTGVGFIGALAYSRHTDYIVGSAFLVGGCFLLCIQGLLTVWYVRRITRALQTRTTAEQEAFDQALQKFLEAP